MPRTLARRIARLERRSNAGCQVCGLGGPGPTTYEVVVPEAVGAVSASEEPPKHHLCPRCGRRTEVWVTFPETRAKLREPRIR